MRLHAEEGEREGNGIRANAFANGSPLYSRLDSVIGNLAEISRTMMAISLNMR